MVRLEMIELFLKAKEAMTNSKLAETFIGKKLPKRIGGDFVEGEELVKEEEGDKRKIHSPNS